jgi:TRAP-type C4-dicarboxylate transport system permease small subunit
VRRLNAALEKVEIAVSTAFIGFIFVLTTLGILTRYVFGSPLSWTEEVINLLYVWVGYVSVCYALSAGLHIRFTSVVTKLGERAQLLVAIFVDVVIISSFAILLPSAIRAADFMLVSPALGVSMKYFYPIVLISYGLLIFHSTFHIFRLVRPQRVEE